MLHLFCREYYIHPKLYIKNIAKKKKLTQQTQQKFMQISKTDPYCEKALQAIVNNKVPASDGFPSSHPNKYVQKPKDVNMFGFEESFSKWINIICNSPTASVIINVKISQPFKLNHVHSLHCYSHSLLNPY